jgi:hypothetical protein
MRFAFRAIMLLSIALCSTAAFAANHWRVEVPFGFTAQGQSFPSGTYDVTFNLNYNIVVMASNSSLATQITSTVLPADAAQVPVVVRFDKMGDNYVLKNIQIEKWVTPNLNSNVKYDTGVSVFANSQ